ncbi:MAG: DUF4936 family protein [Casimicrobiaceae bacterium]
MSETEQPGAATVYVYYRVTGAGAESATIADSDTVATVATVVATLLRDVEHATGIAGSLMRRRDDATTWMEVFAPVTDVDGFLLALAGCEARAGIAALVEDGRRRRECFVPLAVR